MQYNSQQFDHDSVQWESPAANREGNRDTVAGYSPETAVIYSQIPVGHPPPPPTQDPTAPTEPAWQKTTNKTKINFEYRLIHKKKKLFKFPF